MYTSILTFPASWFDTSLLIGAILLASAFVSLLGHWFLVYKKPFVAPAGCIAPAIAMVGWERVPILGYYFRLKGIITSPVGMLKKLHQRFGHFFTIRIPFQNLKLTYVTSPEAYRQIMKLDPETARMGPVMKRVPTVGFWFPRQKDDEASLQTLMLAGKKFMAQNLTSVKAVASYQPLIQHTVLAKALDWAEQKTNLAEALPEAVFHAAGRCVAGDDLWIAIGNKVVPLYRQIANGIDIPRTTLSVTPARFFMPEYKATKKLSNLLHKTVEENRRSGKYALINQIRSIEIEGQPIAEKDIPWMLMYILWNTLTYPGSYIFWMMADILSNPEVLARALKTEDAEAHHRFLRDCFLETIRLHPVTSLVRHTNEDLVLEADDQKYFLPKGGYIGIFVHDLSRDEQQFGQADTYNPCRYEAGEETPSLFGMGAFGCIAKQFSIALATNTVSTLLQRYDFQLLHPIPGRRARVHLTYADQPMWAAVKKAGNGNEIVSLSPIKTRQENPGNSMLNCPFHTLFWLKSNPHLN